MFFVCYGIPYLNYNEYKASLYKSSDIYIYIYIHMYIYIYTYVYYIYHKVYLQNIYIYTCVIIS